MWHPLFAAALAGAILVGGASAQEKARGAEVEDMPVGLCLIPEMDYIPELDDWSLCRPDAFAEDTAKALLDWSKKRAWVEKQLSPELVRALSRWAKPQMKGYSAVPSLAKVVLKPVRAPQAGRKLLLEGTLDTLPTHSPVVTRWLRVYLLYDKGSKRILRATITIRGQLLE